MKTDTDLGHIDQLSPSQTTPVANNLAVAKAAQQPEILEKLLSRLEVFNHLTTEQFAELVHVKPETVRSGLCRMGNYLGIRPVKLPNRRLVWPANDVVRVLHGEEQ